MKKIVIISGIVNCLILILVVSTLDNSDKIIYTNNKSNKVVNANSLTMMYETEASSGEYVVSSDTIWPQDGYVFNSELSSCENGGTLSWSSETNRVIMQTNSSDRCYVYFDAYEPTLSELCDDKTLSECIITQVYTGTDGDNDLYYHDGVGTYTNADQEAGDNSYRYAGANPNNYICFGSNEATCSNDYLYRIIGVFGDQVKLIKYDYAEQNILGASPGDITPNSSYYKGSLSALSRYQRDYPWSSSSLNINILNGTFLSMIESTWSSKIEITNWKTGENDANDIINVPVKNTYTNEIASPAENTTYSAKIGLMYVSDYGYAASPENWNRNLYNYDNDTNRNNNWIFMGGDEWLITVSDISDAFILYNSGRVSSVYTLDFDAVRPTFYLNPDVAYVSGDGTISNPYRIN